MARRKRVYKKIERRDSRYDSVLVGRLICKVMLDGKRSLAQIITEAAWEHRLTVDDGTKHFVPLADRLIRYYIDAVYYLADAGYLRIREA